MFVIITMKLTCQSLPYRVTDSVLGLTSNDTLNVTVSDVNDNAPNITYPTEAAIEVREDTTPGIF